MKQLLALAGLLAALSGCTHAVGYAGAHPGYIRCQGKGMITGTGAVPTQTFTIQADCGEGFSFDQGAVLPVAGAASEQK